MSVTAVVWLGERLECADLPDVQGVSVATLGWHESEAPIELGMPAEVALLFSRWLVESGHALFFDRHLGVGDGARLWRKSAGGMLYSYPGTTFWPFGFRRQPLNVMVTTDKIILATLVLGSDAWAFQQQVVFVTEDHGVVERLDPATLTNWLGTKDHPDRQAIFQHGVRAVLCAGHDGSTLGLYIRDRDTLRAYRHALELICRKGGIDFQRVSTAREFSGAVGYGSSA